MDESANGGIQNNLFKFNENGTDYTINIAPANYSILELLLYLQVEMTSLTGNAHNFLYDSKTFKAEFQITSTTATFDFTNIASPFLELGFPFGSTQTLTSAGGYLTVTSTACIQLSTPQDLYISIPEISTSELIAFNGSVFHFSIPLYYGSPTEINWSYLVDPPKSKCSLYLSSLSNLTTMTFNLYVQRYGLIYKLNLDINASYRCVLKFIP